MKSVSLDGFPTADHDYFALSDGSRWSLTGGSSEADSFKNELAYLMGIREYPSDTPSSDQADVGGVSDLKKYAEQFLGMLKTLQPVYQQSMDRGGLLVHAGLAEWNGKGVLLVAGSGIGKSTCCRRLPDYWRALCDDEVLVVNSPESRYRVHPFPTWSEYLWEKRLSQWDVQYSVPLAGIFFLEQSASDGIASLGTAKAAVKLYESANQICFKFKHILSDKEEKKLRVQLFNNACGILGKIPAFRLQVSLHGSFWLEIERVLGKGCSGGNQ